MGGGAQGGARPDAAERAYIAVSVVIFADGGYSSDDVLAEYGRLDILLFIVYCQLRLVVCAYRSV